MVAPFEPFVRHVENKPFILIFAFGVIGSVFLVAATLIHLQDSQGAEDVLNFLSAIFLLLFTICGLNSSDLIKTEKLEAKERRDMNRPVNELFDEEIQRREEQDVQFANYFQIQNEAMRGNFNNLHKLDQASLLMLNKNLEMQKRWSQNLPGSDDLFTGVF